MTERWEPIVGYEGLYEVSNLGKVRNSRIGTHNYHKELALQPNGRRGSAKYISIGLWKNNKPKYKYLHRLVAEAFIPNPDNKLYVNHIDGYPYNNAVTNLEWCTAHENMQHAVDTGLVKYDSTRIVQACINLKLAHNTQNLFNIRSDGRCYSSAAEAARELHVSADTIRTAIHQNRFVNEYQFKRISKEEYEQWQQTLTV